MTAANDDLQQLTDLAASLRPRFAAAKPLPRLLFVTDPARTPDPEGVAERLPAGSGVLYRHFGAVDAAECAGRLREITRRRGLILLIGADVALAGDIDADGVHLPEGAVADAVTLRQARPAWLLTAAAHSLEAAQRAARAGCDATLVSPVFPSHSPSAGPAMGVEAFTALVQAVAVPVYALGGVNTRTAPQLSGSGAQGLAMVEGLLGAVRT